MKHQKIFKRTRMPLRNTTPADSTRLTTERHEADRISVENRYAHAPGSPRTSVRKVLSRRGRLWFAGLGVLTIATTSLGCHIAPTGRNEVRSVMVAAPPAPSAADTAGTLTPPASPGTGTGAADDAPEAAPSAATVRSAAVTAGAPGTSMTADEPTGSAATAQATAGWMSGVAAGTLTQANQWSAFRGRPVDVVVTFADRSSWETITHPWLGAGPEKFAGFPGTWVISQPFFPASGGDIGACASGAYNSHWQEFGRWLTNQGRAATVVRLAWEFNGSWFPWSASSRPGSWVGCFQQVVGAIRQTDAQVRIDWTMNSHTDGAFGFYPGDAYVDVIGIDTFDMWPASTDENSWNTQCNEAEGLCSVIRFARAHGKKFSVPEWGLVGKQDTGAAAAGQSGGDNPFYIRKMHDTFVANADVLSYEAYFNSPDAGNVHSALVNPTEQPNGAQTYALLW